MCFGNSTQKTTNTSTSGPSWLTGPAQSNINYAQNLQTTGFQPYTGQQVADFSPQQSQSFDLGSSVAGGVSPYAGETGSLINNYANAGPSSVTPETISSQMSPYMNQYVNLALQPQLEAQNQQFASQNKSFDSAATGAGAFGDTSWGLGRSNLTNEQNIAQQGLVGNAYNNAFNAAIGAGAQDVANNLTGQTTNANLNETALNRQLQGANAIYGDTTGATNLVNTLGGQQTAQSQADLNAQYNQWLMAQQYPFQTTQLVNQSIAAATPGAGQNGTSTTTAPDNSGFGILGSVLGSVGAAAIPFMGNGGVINPGTIGGTNPMGDGSMTAIYADGGTIPKGRIGEPVVVGERGPEVIVPNTTGVVIPNEVLEAARLLRDKKLSGNQSNIQFGIAA
jgi:hypothetical protein